MTKYVPGSAEDIRERGLWAAAKDVTGLNEMPYQFGQGLRSIPGEIVGLAELPMRFAGDVNPQNEARLPSRRVHDALGYRWQEPMTKKPLGQLAFGTGAMADVAIPTSAAAGISRGIKAAVNTPADPGKLALRERISNGVNAVKAEPTPEYNAVVDGALNRPVSRRQFGKEVAAAGAIASMPLAAKILSSSDEAAAVATRKTAKAVPPSNPITTEAHEALLREDRIRAAQLREMNYYDELYQQADDAYQARPYNERYALEQSLEHDDSLFYNGPRRPTEAEYINRVDADNLRYHMDLVLDEYEMPSPSFDRRFHSDDRIDAVKAAFEAEQKIPVNKPHSFKEVHSHLKERSTVQKEAVKDHYKSGRYDEARAELMEGGRYYESARGPMGFIRADEKRLAQLEARQRLLNRLRAGQLEDIDVNTVRSAEKSVIKELAEQRRLLQDMSKVGWSTEIPDRLQNTIDFLKAELKIYQDARPALQTQSKYWKPELDNFDVYHKGSAERIRYDEASDFDDAWGEIPF